MKLEQVTYKKYPCIQLLLNRGNLIFLLISLLPFLGSVLVFQTSYSYFHLGAGLVLSAVIYLILRAFLELIQIIADFILPR